MLFKFLKYLRPTNYFNLKKQDNSIVFPDFNSLSETFKTKVVLDKRYQSKEAAFRDASWQAVHRGYIGEDKPMDIAGKLPVHDEYVFIRKYFNPFWVIYVLFFRLFTFHNPLKEIKAFMETRRISRFPLYKAHVNYDRWEVFKSGLLESKPKISVIIPTLSRYHYLKDVLKDLELQTYNNFDVIIVDQTSPFNEKFYSDFDLKIKVWHQEEKALWLARNSAIQSSDADYFLLFDDDSQIEADWIENHLKCLDFFKADISSGTSISVVGAKVPESYAFFKISEQLDTGNVLIKKKVFNEIGLFDRQFEKQRMGDGEFGLRAYLAGFKNISNPYAQRLHLKVGSGGLREMGSWDAFRTKSIVSPRPIPSVLYLYRKYYGAKFAVYALLKTVPISLVPYKYKNNHKVLVLGYLLVVLLFPLVLFQVLKSWRLSSVKLKQGARIDEL